MFSKLVKFIRTPSPARVRVGVFGVMLLAAAAGLIASFALILDEFQLQNDPHAILSCSINVVLNCSTVMQTWQSHILGFPNMIIGLMAFPVVITFALASLAGVKFPRWWLILANCAFVVDLLFSYWLFEQSVYSIQVLCPWCLVVTTATTLIFSSMLHFNLKQNTFKFAKKTNDRIQRFLSGGYHQMIVLGWLAFMVILVFVKFGAALFAQ